eukprot:Lithocolla_globosa_v1_NODE_3045_length_1781_cov_3.306312.p5 type:complete len:113 gc:universal NODE_3045_length_1781_cov_3.306312:1360-1698(+)
MMLSSTSASTLGTSSKDLSLTVTCGWVGAASMKSKPTLSFTTSSGLASRRCNLHLFLVCPMIMIPLTLMCLIINPSRTARCTNRKRQISSTTWTCPRRPSSGSPTGTAIWTI